MMLSSRWLLAVSVMVLAACGDKQPPVESQAAPLSLDSLVVRLEPARSEQVWDGLVEAVHAATLSAQTNARVVELPYDVNDVVPQGAVIVRFTDVEQTSASHAAQAQIASAKAAYVNADANYRRIAAIYARGLIAKADLDLALAQRDTAQAAIAAAQAQWRQVGQQVDYTVVRAPYAGIITRRFVQVGESVQAGPPVPQPLIAIESLQDLRVSVQVPQSMAASIRHFHEAHVLMDGEGGRRVAASKVSVFPYADPDTHTFSVRLELPGENTGLYPGMTVKVAFATDETQRMLIPETALVQHGELQGVYVIDANGISLRQVRTGRRDGGRVELLAGVDDGERVATDPAAAVRWLIEHRRLGKGS